MSGITDRAVPLNNKLINQETGRHFSLLTTEEPVNITVKRSHSRLEEYKNVQAPIYAEFDLDFDVIEIESVSGAAQTVSFGVTSANIKNPRSQGDVNITNTPSIIAAGGTLDALTFPATFYKRVGSQTTLNTIVTPAENVNGVKIYSGYCSMYLSGSRGFIAYKTSAPSNIDDSSAAILFGVHSGTSVNNGGELNATVMPFIVPAGHGIYEQANDSTQSIGALVYKIL